MNTFKIRFYLRVGLTIGAPFFAILLFLKFVLPMISQQHARYTFGEGNEYQTKNFHIFTKNIPETGENIGKWCQGFCDAILHSYGKQFGLSGLPENHVTKIYFFSDRDEFQSHARSETRERMPHNSAYYSHVTEGIVLYWSDRQGAQETLYHELFHMLLDKASRTYQPDFSLWLNEGLAQYFENAEVDGTNLKISLDQSKVEQVRMFWQQKKYISLEKLCLSSSEDFTSQNNTIYYYESYLFVYFLLHADDGKYREKFFRYFQEERSSGSIPSGAIWTVLEKTPEEIENSFRNYFAIGN